MRCRCLHGTRTGRLTTQFVFTPGPWGSSPACWNAIPRSGWGTRRDGIDYGFEGAEASGQIGAVLAEDGRLTVFDVDLSAPAVELNLMNPVIADGRALASVGTMGLMNGFLRSTPEKWACGHKCNGQTRALNREFVCQQSNQSWAVGVEASQNRRNVNGRETHQGRDRHRNAELR